MVLQPVEVEIIEDKTDKYLIMNTAEKVLDEIQKMIDENEQLENIDQAMGYKLALLRVYNKIYSMKFNGEI